MENVFQIGLVNALAACVLALVAGSVGWLFRRPALTHALWLLVLAKLITPPLLTLHIPWSTSSAPQEVASKSVPEIPVPDEAQPEESPERDWVEPRSPDFGHMPVQDIESSPLALAPESNDEPLTENTPSVAEASPPSEPSTASVSWQVIVPVVWLGGSSLWFGLAAFRVIRFHFLLRQARRANKTLQKEADCLARQLGLADGPDVWLVAAPISPMLWAFGGHASLVLPRALLRRLSEEQRATLLLHELAHLRRQDHWVRLLEVIVTGLFWWHPVVWWARREIREAEEQCCDAWVIWAMPDRARGYALTLLETVDFLSEARPLLPPVASGIGYVHDLQRRLTMIMKGTTPRGLSWWGGLAVLGVAGLLLPALPSLDAQSDPRERGPGDERRADDEAARAKAEIDQARANLDRARADLNRAQKMAEDARKHASELERARNGERRIDGFARNQEPVDRGPRAEKACAACHQPSPPKEETLGPKFMKAHDSVVKLSETIANQRENLNKSEAQLKRAAEDMANESRRIRKEGGDARPDPAPRRVDPPGGRGRPGSGGGAPGFAPSSGGFPGGGGFGPPGSGFPGGPGIGAPGGGGGPGFGRGGDDQEKRIDELNKKMELIMQELQALRKEMNAPKQPDRAPPRGRTGEGGSGREGRPGGRGNPGSPGVAPRGVQPPGAGDPTPPGGLAPSPGVGPVPPTPGAGGALPPGPGSPAPGSGLPPGSSVPPSATPGSSPAPGSLPSPEAPSGAPPGGPGGGAPLPPAPDAPGNPNRPA